MRAGNTCNTCSTKGEKRLLTVCYTHLNIPVLVEIVNTGDEASVTVRIVNMPHVPCPVTWVTSNHSLEKKGDISVV